MDIEIVNTILRLCTEEQICLFELPFLCNYCLEQNLCSNSKYILASIRNYMEIFKISRDQQRIEFFMPFEICRNKFLDGICENRGELCSNLHLCYDYFYTNSCRRLNNCSYPHVLTAKYHEDILGSLINLDLDMLSKAFRVYCQSNKHLVNHKSVLIKNPTRMITTPQINGNSSWKIHNRLKLLPEQEIRNKISSNRFLLAEKGLQIYWTPQNDIQAHFIEVVFSNENKSNGSPIRTHQIYQHLGVAQVFYENFDLTDRVIHHGLVTFQSLTFTSRLLQRTIDRRHVCLSNMPLKRDHIDLYIDTISKPYKKLNYESYQNDSQMIVVEYNEDIDFSRIVFNIRNHPECEGLMINCIQLYLPETLFLEYNHQEYSDDDIRKLFDKEKIFHIKTYSYCSFVHFYSHDDLRKSIEKNLDDFIRVTPIYIDIYSQHHLNDYLQRREMTSSPISSENQPIDSSPPAQSEPLINEESMSDSDEDDFHDIPSEFDDDDLVLDESADTNGDMEFIRNAAKNLMSSLTEMEIASTETSTLDAPHSLLYGDDYIVTIKNRRFALAFLDYTQYRVEKQRNPDRFRLLTSLKKCKTNKKRLENNSQNDQIIETKTTKKKRNKRNKKKKNSNSTNQDEDIQLTNQ